jgi:hypothetical protein
MNSETEKLRSKHEQGTQNPTGSVDTSDKNGNSLAKKESPNNHPRNIPPQDISKKSPPQGTDSQDQGQQKIEDEKRRAS